MKRITMTGLLILGLMYKFVESKASSFIRYPTMTQCLRQNDCSPVAYSNDCIAGGSSCHDRGCPGGSQEEDMYP